MMNIAVCEDNDTDRKTILYSLKKHCDQNCYRSRISTFSSGEALLNAFTPGTFDLIFLDVYLGGISGLETARSIRESDPACILIFVTVSPDFVLDAFSVHACSYVLKPVDENKMEKALVLCREIFNKNSRLIKTFTPLGEIEQTLDGAPFVRCHRSYIVNMNYVESVQERSLLMQNHDRIPIRKNRCSEIKATFARFIVPNFFRRELS